MALVQHLLDGIEQRCALGAKPVLQCPVAGALHVREVEAHPGLDALLVEPCEARAEVGAAPALDRNLVGKVVVGVLGHVLQNRVDLEDDDALGADLGRDLAQLRPELGERRGWERARDVYDEGNGVDALGTDGRQVEATVDEAPVGNALAVVVARRVGHVLRPV